MPVRTKTVQAGVEAFLRATTGRGILWFNNVSMTAKINGVTMDRDDFDERYWRPAEAILEEVVDRIDWNRVLIEAGRRHLSVHDEDDLGTFRYDRNYLCSECVCEALLAHEFQDWRETPRVERLRR